MLGGVFFNLRSLSSKLNSDPDEANPGATLGYVVSILFFYSWHPLDLKVDLALDLLSAALPSLLVCCSFHVSVSLLLMAQSRYVRLGPTKKGCPGTDRRSDFSLLRVQFHAVVVQLEEDIEKVDSDRTKVAPNGRVVYEAMCVVVKTKILTLRFEQAKQECRNRRQQSGEENESQAKRFIVLCLGVLRSSV